MNNPNTPRMQHGEAKEFVASLKPGEQKIVTLPYIKPIRGAAWRMRCRLRTRCFFRAETGWAFYVSLAEPKISEATHNPIRVVVL